MNRNSLLLLALAATALHPETLLAAHQQKNVEQLTSESDRVVLGSVLSRSSRWTEKSLIYTDVVIAPDVTLKGDQQASVVVEVPGGIIGDTQMVMSDAPELKTGERVLLFLKAKGGHYEIAGREDGKYTAGTQDAASATEGALQILEKKFGRRMNYQRTLAQEYLTRSNVDVTGDGGCYSQSGAKWSAGGAAYKIGTSIPADWQPSIDASTATWNASGANFAFRSDSNSTNELSFLDLVAKYGSSYSSTYAVTTTWSSVSTNAITKATIEINSNFTWSTSGEANKADVQNILTHEFGHWLRLGDIYSPATCSAVTMWGSAAYGETNKRTLEQPDIDGALSLYGATGSVSTPVLTTPANGATGLGTSVGLGWSAVTGATSYDVYLGTTVAATVAGTSYTASGLTAGTTYSWHVVARTASGSASSATWTFTTATTGGSGSLTAPTLLSPGNGATGVSTVPTLRWQGVTGATSYDVYVGTSASPNLIGSTSGTAVRVSGFARGTVYYWKIVAKNASGSASSAVWSFQTY